MLYALEQLAERGQKRSAKFWRLRAWLTIFTPFAGSLTAVAWAAVYGLEARTVGLALFMYAATMFGITVGFHRYLAHRSFECARPFKWVVTIFGCMAAQGPPLFWVAVHRLHHQHADGTGDPHSPTPGSAWFGSLAALWHAHVGWMLEPVELAYARLVPDLLRDRDVVRIAQFYVFWVLVGMVGPGLILFSLGGGTHVLIEGVLFGGLVRTCLVHHAIWAVNSIGHRRGSRPYATKDASGNLAWLALPTFGAAWHNNHHAFPYSAREGLAWWQLDLNFLALKVLSRLGIVWDLKVPPSDLLAPSMEAKS
jgi:stearoyl-CoA desaturase (delta-9 desaturase)